jgi:hypothetical protein
MMKLLITLFSSLAVGLLMSAVEHSPLTEARKLFVQRRRILTALVMGQAGLILLVAGLITAVIEAALQFEVQGFLLWSALFSAACALAVLGAVFSVGAYALLPALELPTLSWAALDERLGISHLIEHWAHQAAEVARTPPEPAETEAEPTPRNRKVDIDEPEERVHH